MFVGCLFNIETLIYHRGAKDTKVAQRRRQTKEIHDAVEG